MKLATQCMVCAPDLDTNERGEALFAELEDDRTLVATCSKGHENRFVLQQSKFELLMEMGGMALLDGYYREAIASFAAAVERFLEFYIRVVAETRDGLFPEFDVAWKQMSKHSERQLGAFMILHLFETGKTPQFNQTMIELRNNVIHKGLFPSQDDAYSYGKWAFQFIVSTALHIRTKHPESANKAIARSMGSAFAKLREKPGMVGTQYTSMFLSWADSMWAKATFDASMKNLAERRHDTWAAPTSHPNATVLDKV